MDFLQFQDVFSGLVKAAVFGFLIALMGCYHGFTSRGGAQGVGVATTNAVVSASILILTFNYFITEAFFAADERPPMAVSQDRAAGRHQGVRAEAGAAAASTSTSRRADRWS